jgi:hypothetical protein
MDLEDRAAGENPGARAVLLSGPNCQAKMNAPSPKPIHAQRALYIKLGQGGSWESRCIDEGDLRFGYHAIPHQAALDGKWKDVTEALQEYSTDPGAITRHLNQVKEFYEADANVLWITFFSDRLWWTRSPPILTLHDDATKTRSALGGWRDTDLSGVKLLKSRLSGKLLALQMFQGTICTVNDLGYLLHKINASVEPHVAAAQAAYETLQAALLPIIQKLHPKDLEVLVDLVFRQSGWQRVGVAGGVEKDIDLDLISPVTQERIAVQVKSAASPAVWRAYRAKYSDMRGFSRFYFVTHTASAALADEAAATVDQSFVLWDGRQLAAQVVRGGLTGWLIDKAV